MSLFKKKPGGTKVGNLLRVAANKFSGGVLGQGQDMIPLEQEVHVKGVPPELSPSRILPKEAVNDIQQTSKTVLQDVVDTIKGLGKLGNEGLSVKPKFPLVTVLVIGGFIFLIFKLFKRRNYAKN